MKFDRTVFVMALILVAYPTAMASQSPASALPMNPQPAMGGSLTPIDSPASNIVGKTAAQRANGYPMALTYLKRETGSSLIYLGNQGGVLGYLGFGPNNTEQTFYIWPNGVDFVVGTLFNSRGDNISKQQIAAMDQRYKAAMAGKKITAEDVPTSHSPNAVFTGAKSIPFMRYVLSRPGMSYIHVGGDGGTPSYLVKNGSPDAVKLSQKLGFAQMFYITPTGRDAVAGIMFGEYGQDITSTEMMQMSQKIRAFLSNTASVNGSSMAPSQNTATKIVAQNTVAEPQKKADAVPTAGVSIPFQESPIKASDFYNAVKYTASFSVGKPSAPSVWMVSDVQCPHCHAAWDSLKPMVLAGKIRLRIILVDDQPSSEPYTISILTQQNPGLAWLRGWGSSPDIGNIPAPPNAHSTAYKTAETWIADNMAFVQKLGITGTPFIAYTDQSGQFFAEQGPISARKFVANISK